MTLKSVIRERDELRALVVHLRDAVAAADREVEECHGVIETFGRVTTQKVPDRDELELHYVVNVGVLIAGGIEVFDYGVRDCRAQWQAKLARVRERASSERTTRGGQ